MPARPSKRRRSQRFDARCRSGKRRYTDRLAALLALAETFPRRSSRREETAAYECVKCGGWHLTSYDGDAFGDAAVLERAI